VGRKVVWIEVDAQRVWCKACKIVRMADLGIAKPRVRYTKAFARYALELARLTTIQEAADHLRVSWDTIKELQKASLKKRFSKPRLDDLKWIAIDEISIGHGHRYVTLVLNLLSGAVVYVADGKDKEALTDFWEKLRSSSAKVEAVAIDMGIAYITAVSENLPGAALVFDHFHIVKLFNEKLSALRRLLYHQATDKQKKVLKGSRWLLLKNPEHLDLESNEAAHLKEALDLNAPLATAYYLKEDLRQLWSQRNKAQAGKFLSAWLRRVEASKVQILIKLAHFLGAYRSGILAWYDYNISTGPLEGTNNKIKTMQRMAYGYRDKEFFRLKIYALHESRYALVG
jgi:transposase